MLAIYPVEEIRKWDSYTIDKEPIISSDLMERASLCCSDWLVGKFGRGHRWVIFCGNGNNGGDGLCIARHLFLKKCDVHVCILPIAKNPSPDFALNFDRLSNLGFQNFLKADQIVDLLNGRENFIAVDAILGSGLNRKPSKDLEQVFKKINEGFSTIVSIDIPSGMYADRVPEHECIQASHTLSLQSPKLSALFPETGSCYGELIIINIGLSPNFLSEFIPRKWFIEHEDIQKLIKSRNAFDYKSKFGHVLVVGGCMGMAGAVLLAARAALRSGCGLCTIASPEENRIILQSALPEAIYCLQNNIEINKYNVIAMGPGMGTSENMGQLLSQLLGSFQGKVVLDADALNLIKSPEYFERLKQEIVITPHVGEFDRLFGKSHNAFDRLELAIHSAKRFNITIVLKGHYTSVINKEGIVYFNSTGNPGLAKGGSGDVLCGMIASFLAQGYLVTDACLLAVYLHGYTADLLLNTKACESILASDLIDTLPESFQKLKRQ